LYSRRGLEVIMFQEMAWPLSGSVLEGRATESDREVAVAPSNLQQQHTQCNCENPVFIQQILQGWCIGGASE
jgi:hypothetical protein